MLLICGPLILVVAGVVAVITVGIITAIVIGVVDDFRNPAVVHVELNEVVAVTRPHIFGGRRIELIVIVIYDEVVADPVFFREVVTGLVAHITAAPELKSGGALDPVMSIRTVVLAMAAAGMVMAAIVAAVRAEVAAAAVPIISSAGVAKVAPAAAGATIAATIAVPVAEMMSARIPSGAVSSAAAEGPVAAAVVSSTVAASVTSAISKQACVAVVIVSVAAVSEAAAVVVSAANEASVVALAIRLIEVLLRHSVLRGRPLLLLLSVLVVILFGQHDGWFENQYYG